MQPLVDANAEVLKEQVYRHFTKAVCHIKFMNMYGTTGRVRKG